MEDCFVPPMKKESSNMMSFVKNSLTKSMGKILGEKLKKTIEQSQRPKKDVFMTSLERKQRALANVSMGAATISKLSQKQASHL
jgi:hypothetical protein